MTLDTAVVLAAGEGTRFRPLTAPRPKPMLPVGARPLLHHVVDCLANAGIERVVIVVGYRRERIQGHFGNGDEFDVDITYVTQETPRGTGHALLQAEYRVGEEFLVVNGDRIVESSLIERLMTRREATGEACMAVTQVDDPTAYGMVTIEDDRVVEVVEKPPDYAATSKLVNAGIYALGPDVFAALRETAGRGELALTDVLETYRTDHPVRAVRYDGLWFELTTPWDLVVANDTALSRLGSTVDYSARVHDDASVGDPVAIGEGTTVQPGARVLRGTTLGSNVRVGANAVLTNTVVLDDATIGAGTVLENSIVGAGATIGPNTTVESGTTDIVVDDSLYTDVTFGGLIGDQAELGSNVTVAPGVFVGNGRSVPSDTHVVDHLFEW